MVTIAVINKNRCTFDDMEKYAAPLLYRELTREEKSQIMTKLNDYIWSVIEPYITFVQIETTEQDEIMTKICSGVKECFPEKSFDDFRFDTIKSYSFPKKIIQFVDSKPTWPEYKHEQECNMNNIACYMSLDHKVIENNAVAFCFDYDMQSASMLRMGSITKEDIIKIIRRRYIFTGVLIKEKSIVKYYYQEPVYLFMSVFNLNSEDNIPTLRVTNLKYNLLFHFVKDKRQYVNKVATRINGMFQLCGDVLMMHELEEKVYANLSCREAKRLNVLSYGKLSDRNIKDNESNIDDLCTSNAENKVVVDKNGTNRETKVVPFWSRYIIIEKRMEKWKECKQKCITCDSACDDSRTTTVCDVCFRARYCSALCKQNYATCHVAECINPKSLASE